MIRADQIPEEVVEAAKITYTAQIYKGQATAREYHDAMCEAITSALNAWPDVVDTSPNNIGHLVLQFKENQDE